MTGVAQGDPAAPECAEYVHSGARADKDRVATATAALAEDASQPAPLLLSDGMCSMDRSSGKGFMAMSADPVSRILYACSAIYSRWFSAMRSAIGRERSRQYAFKQENGLPKGARIPYSVPDLTPEEATTAAISEAVVRAMFGDAPADYARDKFRNAIETGDMRSFKIRLLFIKTRDSLAGMPMHRQFADGMGECIAEAERAAGCKPDPSPRRLSRKEKERKRIKEEAQNAQPELPLIWTDGYDKVDSKEIGVKEKISTEFSVIQNQSIPYSKGADEGTEVVEKGSDAILGTSSHTQKTACVYTRSEKKRKKPKTLAKTESGQTETDGCRSITVMKNFEVTVIKAPSGRPVRKAREYSTVDQILDDIEDGLIEPYESSDEICEDLKAGLITPVEALMFTDAIGRYCSEFGRSDMDEGFDEDEEDWSEDEQEEDEIEEGCVRGTMPNYSYNPRGFAGLGGHSDSDADWNMDDEW